MNVEIFTICDAAADYGGRMSILGAFDVIHGHQFPAAHPQCSVALRLRFDRLEIGEHRFQLSIVDADGQHILPPLQGQIGVKIPPGQVSSAINLILNLQRLHFAKPGEYSVNFEVDDEQVSYVPIFVNQV